MTGKLVKFFSSVKLTVFLFLVLAATSILGTLVRQDLPLETQRSLYSPTVFSVLNFFNAFDMYHSWWFTALLVLLALNIIVCTRRQFARIGKLVFGSREHFDDAVFRTSPIRRKYPVRGDIETIRRESDDIVRELISAPATKTSADSFFMYAEKGRYSRLGMPFVHISVLLILFGGVIGTLFGFIGQMNIIEGEQSREVTLYGDRETKNLEFDVRCDKFTVDFYETGMPREYRSDLSIVDRGGETLASNAVRVNHPFVYEGLKFCQASYGIAGALNYLVGVRNEETGEKLNLRIDAVTEMSLPDGEAVLVLAKFLPDYKGQGPTVLAALVGPGEKRDMFRIFRDGSRFNRVRKSGLTFSLKDFDVLYYTGIQVSRDPGVVFVWTGFILIILGFVLHLFFSHKRVWVKLSGSPENYELWVAASADKNRKALEEKLDGLIAGKLAVEQTT